MHAPPSTRRHPEPATTTNPDAGFTLIELLVVVVIVGVLAAIAIPTFLNQRHTAQIASVKADLKAAATAMEEVGLATGSYPASVPAGTRTSPGVSITLPGAVSANDARFFEFLTRCNNLPAPNFCEYPLGPAHGTDQNGLRAEINGVYNSYPPGAAVRTGWWTGVGMTGTPATIPASPTPPPATGPVTSYCLQGVHAAKPTEVWKWESANGGLRRGTC